ncbi:MAG: acyl carrier protein [Calditrichaeota bacterium]|nr:acyl carrier protein [Calditrichota bacterium]
MDMYKEIVAFLYDESLKDEFAQLDYDDSLLELGIIDSVKMLDLINFIEEKFGIKVEDDDLYPENFDSINAIVNYINSKT